MLKNLRKIWSPALSFYLLALSLFAFELANYDTTRYALATFYEDQAFLGVTWASLFALAACLADFGGLSRMFTPERGRHEPAGVWVALVGWLIAAFLNAWMTWWATITVMAGHAVGNEVMTRSELLTFVPIAIAVMVLVIRVSLIMTLSGAGERLLHGPRRTRQPKTPQFDMGQFDISTIPNIPIGK